MTSYYTRRDFVVGAAGAGGVLAGTARARAAPGRVARQADARIDVLADEPIGTIAPEIYGHFVEHLGGVVYDGIWVGEQSRIANVGGIRRALIDALRTINPSVIRWPGGCFADAYDWRDGVGPRAARPRRPNVWSNDENIRALGTIPQRFEPNQFGTNEFMRFCRLAGAQPYLAVNLRSLPAHVFFDWLEYCNAPRGSTTLADARAANGDPEPFGVKYWGIGNEAWGCGGNFRPEEYASEYRRFTTWSVPTYGPDPAFIASGPSGGDLEWTRRFFHALDERGEIGRLWGWSLHHYSSTPEGDALAFGAPAWYGLLASANRMERLITSQWDAMGELDRAHHVKLVVDEWGAWYRMSTNVAPAHLFGQQSTLRDAVLTGLTLDTFNRHADKVAMANVAQLVNCLQSLFLADGDRFLRTPVYHVFAMYAPHQGGTALRTIASAPLLRWTDERQHEQTLWGLNGSASRKAGTVTLTVTNPHPDEPRETEIAVRGAAVRSVTATTLAGRDIHDHNTFENPDAVVPAVEAARAVQSPFTYRFPPASVTRLSIELGS